MKHSLVLDIVATSLRWLGGIGLGTALALSVYFLSLIHWKVRKSIELVANFARSIPVIALIPVFGYLFGLAESGKIATIALATSLPIYIYIVRAAQPDSDHEIVLAVGQLNRLEMLRWLYGPMLAKSLTGGFRVAIGIGWISVVAAEALGVPQGGGTLGGGLGDRVSSTEYNANLWELLFTLGVFGVLGIGSTWLFERIVVFQQRWTGVDLR